MSDLEPDLRPAGNDDGLDSPGGPARDAQGRFTSGGADGGGEQGAGGAWVDAITDPDLKAYVQQQGFQTPDDLARSMRETQRSFHERAQQVAALEQALAHIPQQQEPDPQFQTEEFPFTLADLQAAYEVGELDARQYGEAVAAWSEAIVAERTAELEQRIEERIAPIVNTVQMREVENAAFEMDQTYGPELPALIPQAQSLMQQYPQRYPNSVDGFWSAVAMAKAQQDFTSSQRQRQQARANTLNQSARGGQAASPDYASAVINAIENVRRPVNDGL